MIFNLSCAVNAAQTIGSWYPSLKAVYAAIGAVLSAMVLYRVAYKIIGLFSRGNLRRRRSSINTPW